ncbi:hypothetical protein [Maridesulfovibrio hydrothermalis]|uniref:PEP-CTERM protein-sorting domain-containing protein n=1 Tax=Maridesulfovibrio hydrothermalis AM13 = DSM 14728 TaxID=1121451 RepID=L0RBU4_9BACT|nr:hypothetical protein [Maridesulfovibrio hydrothermalis]CCO24258.1 exported protein of unknown function [Maridesulfovibrio hydrothermalis AM13 = DSM 14728]
MRVAIKSLALGMILSLFAASFAGASTIRAQTWGNEVSGVHTMQFWVTNPDVSIKSIKMNSHSAEGWSWAFFDDSKTSVVFNGPETAGAHDVLTQFKFTAPQSRTKFGVEWAEISQGNVLTGTLFYNANNKKRWTSSYGEISNTPTPIPGAVLIFGGGLSLLAFARRRFSRS